MRRPATSPVRPSRWVFFVRFVAVSVIVGLVVTVIPLATASLLANAATPFVQAWKAMPSSVGDVSIAAKNTFYAADGSVFAQTWVQDRTPLTSIDQVSPYAREGLIATEDKNFYKEGAVDVLGILRSAASGSGGGSGITQQLVKNLEFYNNSADGSGQTKAVANTLTRKIGELKLAVGYATKHSKNQVLLDYFNTVAFGGPSTYSIETASQYFFGVSAKNLTLAQAAVLVGSVQNPSEFNLNDDSASASWTARQHVVLDRMVAEGYVTRAQADVAEAEHLTFVRQGSGGTCAASTYQFYCEYVTAQLRADTALGDTQEDRDSVIARGGLQIHTYLQGSQVALINKVTSDDFGNDNPVIAPTAVVVPGTGAVTGIGANRDYGTGSGETTIPLATSGAGTGSAYKMVTLAAALEAGFTDSQLQFSSDCPLYPGSNYDAPSGGFRNSNGCAGGFQAGNLNYQQATAWSSNTWFVTLGMKVGMPAVLDMSKELGLDTDGVSDRALSFVIGSQNNTPVAMAAAYATFADGGVYCPPTPVSQVTYTDGTSPTAPDDFNPATTACRRVMSPRTAAHVLQALRANTVPGVVSNSFGTDGYISGHDAWGKSGTNESLNYAWAQVSGQYAVFTDVYDMDETGVGVVPVEYKGEETSTNVAPAVGSDVLRGLLSGLPNVTLDVNSQDTSKKPVAVPSRAVNTVPDVLALEPSKALAVMRSAGLNASVARAGRSAPSGFPVGTVVSQSVAAGQQIPVGSSQTITLYVAE